MTTRARGEGVRNESRESTPDTQNTCSLMVALVSRHFYKPDWADLCLLQFLSASPKTSFHRLSGLISARAFRKSGIVE